MRPFLIGFAACYLLGAVVEYGRLSQLPFVTPAGAAFLSAVWLPYAALPAQMAADLTPEWVTRNPEPTL